MKILTVPILLTLLYSCNGSSGSSGPSVDNSCNGTFKLNWTGNGLSFDLRNAETYTMQQVSVDNGSVVCDYRFTANGNECEGTYGIDSPVKVSGTGGCPTMDNIGTYKVKNNKLTMCDSGGCLEYLEI